MRSGCLLPRVLGMRGYIDVAGLRTWHEVPGEGDPLVLVHGGLAGAFLLPAPDWNAFTG